MVVGLAIAIGLVTAVAVSVAAGRNGGGSAASSGQSGGCQPLSGSPQLVLQLPGRRLPAHAAAADAYLRAAEQRLPAGDVRTAVARAVARYPGDGAQATLHDLQALPQSEPVVQLYVGLTELWAGRCAAAEAALRRARDGDRYGFYGTIADNTLHAADMLAGYPLYIPGPGVAHGTVAQLEARARRRPDDPNVWLGLAYAAAGRSAPGRAGGGPARARRSTPPASTRGWR